MVTLDKLREFMKKKAEEDRGIRSVTVSGSTMEDALKEAAIELGVPVRRLEYDVIQKGAQGVMGFNKKNWTLIAYPMAEAATSQGLEGFGELEGHGDSLGVVENPNKDGECFVRLWSDGVYIKVTKPAGEGQGVTEEEALDLINQRPVRNLNRQAVKGAVGLAMGTYVKVGDFIHNSVADAMVTVFFEDQEMRCLVQVSPPSAGGADLTREDLEHFLRNNGIVHGLLDKQILDFIDSPVYKEKILMAEGTKPTHGKDARIQYFFDTTAKVKPKEVEGRVDFKNLGSIHNVVKGEELAKKEPAERGINGRTVTGRILPARDGKDIEFELGNNVNLSKDGLRVTASADGQVMLIQKKITVETVLVIPGDVNLTTGNVNVYGSVIVKGHVEDGFTVKAVGNIEIYGTVGKCVLDTQGDIVVHQGIKGGGNSTVQAGQSVWSKFIENAKVTAGNFVVASDGIVNSNIIAFKKVICKGKRAKIMGGYVRATEEINASALGSAGSGETILEVGFDPKGKSDLEECQKHKDELEKQLADAALNIQGLQKLARVRGGQLPKEKEDSLKALQKTLKDTQAELEVTNQKLETLLREMEGIKNQGKIACSGPVLPGVKIIIRDTEFDVIRDYSGITFILEGSVIRTVKYEEIEEEELEKIRRP